MLDLTTIVLFVGVFFLSLWYLRIPKNLPPGPTNWPLLGFLPLGLPKSKLDMLESLRKTYGDIYVIWQGSNPMVLLFGQKLIREALVDNAEYLSERPTWMHINKHLNRGKGIIWNPHKWREIRKFVMSSLRDFGAGPASLEGKIHLECEAVVKEFNKTGGKAFDCHNVIVNAVSNIICMVVFGRRYEYDDPQFHYVMETMDDAFKNGAMLSRLNYFPWLAYIAWKTDWTNRFEKFIIEVEKFIQKEINQHREQFDPTHVGDFIDLYLENEASESNGQKISEADLRRGIFDLFGAGTETTATTLQWLFVYMMRMPDIQFKCRQEIHEVIGSHRLPTMSDRSKLTYTEAVLLETQRMANIAPWALPHSCRHPVKVGGYTIPKDAIVIPMLRSSHLDAEEFPEPERFLPERWIHNGKVNSKHPGFMPFSLGRRQCPGEQIARMELFLFGVTFLQRFKLQPVGEIPSMEGHVGLTLTPKPFQMKVIPVS